AGPIPQELGNLRVLGTLRLNSNRLTGIFILTMVSIYSALIWMNFADAWTPTVGRTVLGNLTKLKHLWLQNNELTGPIPEALGKLSALRKLHLNNNNLSGEISNSLEATRMNPADASG
ncbi:unnamed protein product, partial [Ectocarpus sp. 12 AP-2014]